MPGSSCWMSFALRAPGRIPGERVVDDLQYRPGLRAARGAATPDELGARVDVWIRVRFNQVRGSVLHQPKVEAGVVAQTQRLEGRERVPLHPRDDVVAQPRHADLAAAIRAGAVLPLHLGPGDARRALREMREVELHRRHRLRPRVSEHADIDLTALDVLLDEDGMVEVGMQLVDALHQLLDAARERVEPDADRA